MILVIHIWISVLIIIIFLTSSEQRNIVQLCTKYLEPKLIIESQRSPKSYFQVDCVPLQRKAAQRHDQETSQGVQGGAGETQKQSRRKCTTNFFSDVT